MGPWRDAWCPERGTTCPVLVSVPIPQGADAVPDAATAAGAGVCASHQLKAMSRCRGYWRSVPGGCSARGGERDLRLSLALGGGMGRWDRMGRALLELPWFSATPSWAPLALLPSCPGASGPAPPQRNTTSPAGHRGAAVGASGIPFPGVPVPCIPISGVPIPGVSIPGVPVPGIPVSGISIPGVPVPGVSIPGILVPGAPVPGVLIPAVPLSAVPIPTGPGRRAAAGTWALPSPSLVSRLPASSSLLSLSLFSPSLVPHVPMERGSSLGLAYGAAAEPCKGLGPLLSPQNPLELCRAPQTGAPGK